MGTIKNNYQDSEQIGEDMSRIQMLELELKRLKQENEELKLNKFDENSNKMLALEAENKKLSSTIQQFQQLQVCLIY